VSTDAAIARAPAPLRPAHLRVAGVVAVAAAGALLDRSSFVEHAVWMVVAGSFFGLAAVLRPRDLGMGDVKFVLLLGALLGREVLPALAIGCCLVAAVALALIVRYGRPALRRYLPLGPFLAAGALAVLLLSGSH
jgi:leader peptidase (prepilin peptidase)/N-methyltransferase